MKFLAVIVLAFLAAAPARVPAQGIAQPKTIDIRLPASKQAAFSHAMAAFVDAGLVVTAADDAGVIRAGPFPRPGDETLVTYWANVLGDVNRARVVLRATTIDARSPNTVVTLGAPLTADGLANHGQLWDVLEQVEAKIRAAFPSAGHR